MLSAGENMEPSPNVKKTLKARKHSSTKKRTIKHPYNQIEKPDSELLPAERETDTHRLAQRQKQIDYGKNTLGYDAYVQKIPKSKRRRPYHLDTPNKHLAQSKRQWDHKVRKWRSFLHSFDKKEKKGEVSAAENKPSATEKGKQEVVDVVVVPASTTIAAASDNNNNTSRPSIYGDFVEDEDDLL